MSIIGDRATIKRAETAEEQVIRGRRALEIANKTAFERGIKVEQLRRRVAQLEDAISEALKCRDAANSEGLSETLASFASTGCIDRGSVSDLTQRHLLPAFDLLASCVEKKS